MQVSSTSPSSTSPVNAGSDSTVSRLPSKALGQEDFLKLLAVQFQKQDPMKPMEDTSFIAQMAQFTSLDQTSAMSRDLTAMRSDQERVVANSYLGHNVTVDAGDGSTPSGNVSGIDVTGSSPRIMIGDKSYPLSAVLLVEPARITTPATPPVSTGGA